MSQRPDLVFAHPTRSRFVLLRVAAQCLLAACCLFGLPGAALAGAQDYILDKAYWTDTTGTASFEQARAARYTPYTGVLSKGFTRDVQWVRLKIDGVPIKGPSTLVLRIRPVYLDKITLFDPADFSSNASMRTAGDRVPLIYAEFESLHHTFVIPAQPTPRDVWLRLETNSTQLMHVEALAPRVITRDENILAMLYSVLLALILSFLILVFLVWLRDHDPVNATFVIRQTILLIHTACSLGYHRYLLSGWLSPETTDFLWCGVVLLTTGLSIVFEYSLLREYVLPHWGHALIRMLLFVSIVAIGLLLMGYTREALRANMMLNGAGILTLLIVSLSMTPADAGPAPRRPYCLPKAALVAYYLTILLVLAVSILPSLSLLQGVVLSIYGFLTYGLISGLLMTILLVIRARRIEEMRSEVFNRLEISRAQLEIEKRRRNDQSQLLDMLMHEIKTPLSVIDRVLHKQRWLDKVTEDRGNRAVNSIKAILDRCIQTDRLAEERSQVRRQRFDLALHLQQWLDEWEGALCRIQLQVSANAELESDPHLVQIIVSNLIDNALKYSDPQQQVQLTLQQQVFADGRPGWALRVGNPPGQAGWPQAERLFVKYYRSPGAQRQSGTGLGLFLARSLALQLGGQLDYRPDNGKICFELWLPV